MYSSHMEHCDRSWPVVLDKDRSFLATMLDLSGVGRRSRLNGKMACLEFFALYWNSGTSEGDVQKCDQNSREEMSIQAEFAPSSSRSVLP